MAKYSLLPEQLKYEGTLDESDFFAPEILPEEDILRVHTVEYWTKLKTLSLSPTEVRRTGFPLSPALIDRERTIAMGTVMGARNAIELKGISLNIAGGTHHAYSYQGTGFCLLNDQAIAARHCLDNGLAGRVLIIDLDVHQGDGTAEIFHKEDRVFTFSMHGAHNFPVRKQQSNLDIPLPDKTDDDDYLSILSETLPKLISEVKPDLLFFQAGVDVLESDALGRLSLSLEGCRQRDELVFQTAKDHELPISVSMGGSYSPHLSTIIEAHANTFRLAKKFWG